MRYQVAPAEIHDELIWLVFDTGIDFVIGEFDTKEKALKFISTRVSQDVIHSA